MKRKVFFLLCLFIVLSVVLSVWAEEPYPQPIPLGISGGNIMDSNRLYCSGGTLAVASSIGQEYSPPDDQLKGLAQTLFASMLGVIGQSLTKGIDAQIMFFSFSTIPTAASVLTKAQGGPYAQSFSNLDDNLISKVPAADLVPIKMFSDPVPGAEIYIEQEPSEEKAQGGPYAQSFSNLDDPISNVRQPIDYGIMEEGIKSAAAIPGGSVLASALGSSREAAVIGLDGSEVSYNEPEQVEPMWDAPMEDIHFILVPPMAGKSGTIINGLVTLRDIAWLEDERMSNLGPFFIVIKSEKPDIALFPGRRVFLEHIIDTALIKDDGSYNFSFTMKSCGMGKIGLKFLWKWRILTEGGCSTAILGVYGGCKASTQDAAQYNRCVCDTLANMPWPGSWLCEKHPLTFREVWKEHGCPGTCPY